MRWFRAQVPHSLRIRDLRDVDIFQETGAFGFMRNLEGARRTKTKWPPSWRPGPLQASSHPATTADEGNDHKKKNKKKNNNNNNQKGAVPYWHLSTLMSFCICSRKGRGLRRKQSVTPHFLTACISRRLVHPFFRVSVGGPGNETEFYTFGDSSCCTLPCARCLHQKKQIFLAVYTSSAWNNT